MKHSTNSNPEVPPIAGVSLSSAQITEEQRWLYYRSELDDFENGLGPHPGPFETYFHPGYGPVHDNAVRLLHPHLRSASPEPYAKPAWPTLSETAVVLLILAMWVVLGAISYVGATR